MCVLFAAFIALLLGNVTSLTVTSVSIKPEWALPFSTDEIAAAVLTFQGTKYLVVSSNHGTKPGTLIFNTATGVWTVGRSCPFPGSHQAPGVWLNKVYLFGGTDAAGGKVQIGSLFRMTTGAINIRWTAGTGVPFNSASAGLAVYSDGQMLYCGGTVKNTDPTIPSKTVSLSRCAMYTPSSTGGSWNTDFPSMPGARNHAAYCLWNDKFYIFGGRGGERGPAATSVTSEATMVYDRANRLWTATVAGDTATPAAIPEVRGGMGSAVCTGGVALVFGGENLKTSNIPEAGLNDKAVYYRSDIYDFATNTWSRGADMAIGLHGIYPILLNGQVLIAAGATINRGNAPSNIFQVATLA